MESKAQKSAIAAIKQLINKDIFGQQHEWDVRWDHIDKMIEEYSLKDSSDIIEAVYDALMKKGCFEKAASFAKKYGV